MTDSEKPIVSIVMPTYNRGRLIEKSVESVLKQTLKAWELIIIDDASVDDTPKVLKELAARDKRIIILRNEKNEFRQFGIMKTLNRGLETARGRYIARLDDDDWWFNERKLEKQAAFLDAHPDYVVVGCGTVVFDKNGKEQFRYLKKETDAELRKSALSANPFTHTAVMFRADVAAKVGRYQGMYIEDWDLWLRMGLHGKFYNFQEYMTGYTMSPANYSFIHQRALSRTVLRLLYRHRHDYPGYPKAYLVNLAQYLYSFVPMPLSLRVWLRTHLGQIKRKLL
ncbi:MAG TPA: glycosyltransferase family 2 protein [Candidatus Paceibacterota bacterium]|nr:glycosyltransferase family 2 protein [Candidatus Paceibacterota bacterium]